MNVYDSLEAAAVCRHAVIALGTFDGVHVGHRRVMETAMSEGKRLHVPTLVLTFSAHPLSVLNPLKEPARLATVEQKEEYIRSVGIDGLIMLPMTQELLNQSPEDFCACLIKYLAPSEIVVGTNFTYGKKAAGNTYGKYAYSAKGSSATRRCICNRCRLGRKRMARHDQYW